MLDTGGGWGVVFPTHNDDIKTTPFDTHHPLGWVYSAGYMQLLTVSGCKQLVEGLGQHVHHKGMWWLAFPVEFFLCLLRRTKKRVQCYTTCCSAVTHLGPRGWMATWHIWCDVHPIIDGLLLTPTQQAWATFQQRQGNAVQPHCNVYRIDPDIRPGFVPGNVSKKWGRFIFRV